MPLHKRNQILFAYHRLMNVRHIRGALLLFVLALLLTLPAVGVYAQQPTTSPPYDPAQVTLPLAPPEARAGRASYVANCAPCHGVTGNADGPTVPDLPLPPTAFADPAAVWDLSPAMFFHTTKFGRLEALMPPWGNRLSDGEIWDTVAYAWGLHTSERAVANGAVLYAESCASCHGVGGAGDGPEATGELPDFTDAAYVTFRSQADWSAGWQSAHPEIGEQWALVDQEAVLEFMRTFSYTPSWAPAFQPGAGVISGQVAFGVTGEPVTADQVVRLDAYLNFEPVASFTTTVGAGGMFNFDQLATNPEITYIASTSLDGMSYSSDLLTLSAEQPAVVAEIAVYESTDDPAGLRISRLHWIVDTQPGALVVAQIYAFGNEGQRTYVGQTVDGVDEPVTVGFYVPAEAVEITLENGELGNRFQRVGDRVYDTLPVVPGAATRQVVVQYALPYNGVTYDVAQQFDYPVDQLTLLVADLPNLQVEAPALDAGGVQDIQGSNYQIFSKAELPGGEVALNLRGLLERGTVDPRTVTTTTDGAAAPMATILPPMESWVTWVMIGLVSAGLLAAVGIALQRGTLAFGHSRQDLNQLRNSLIQQIAHVDDQHAAGAITNSAWLQQRSLLKAQLVDVTQRLEYGRRAAAD
jgi:mono/diheme cytochrome c family protein